MLYPLKFSPILKDKIWGGTKLKTLFGKPATSDHLGESWELSGYEGDESVVTNGFLAGNNLAELLEVYMGDLVGDRVFERYGHTCCSNSSTRTTTSPSRCIRTTRRPARVTTPSARLRCGTWWMPTREPS